MPRKRQSKAIRDAKGNPGKRAPDKTRAKKSKRPPAATTTPAAATDAKGPPSNGKKPDLAPAPKVPGGTPAELTKPGKAIWQMLAPMLVKTKLYIAIDRHALARYCDSAAEYWKVTRSLRKQQYTYNVKKVGGGTMLRYNPLFIVQDRLARRLDALEHQFGLTPRARGEILHRLQAQFALPLDGDETAVPAPAPDPDNDQAPGSAVGFLPASPDDAPTRVH